MTKAIVVIIVALTLGHAYGEMKREQEACLNYIGTSDLVECAKHKDQFLP